MDNKKELIIETFNSKFNLQKFINFTQELFKGNAKYKSNIEFSPKIKGEFRDVVKEFLDLGWYKDKNRKSMAIAVVRLESEDTVARSRAIQRNFVKDYFLKSGSHSALVAFYNNNSEDWRLSFIKLDYSYKEAKLEEDLTPAKRFSFLLGENEKHHTAISRFLPLLSNDKEAPTIAEIEEAFNIEVVTKEFFEKYCDLYLEIKKCLDAQEGFNKIARELDIRSDEFAKKLMGQLVFLYFLQKKGWLGVEANPIDITEIEASQLLENKTYDAVDAFEKVYELKDDIYIRNDNKIIDLSDEEVTSLNSIFINTKYDANWGSGDKNFIRSLYNKAIEENKNFYNDYLQHVFYNALNDKRGGSTYFKELNCKIPFLNGGLFQPISENYNWEVPEFSIPNEIFSNKKKTKQDIGTGVLDIFDRYAFTIKEDEPLEKEVAVDPEMLGKVFENLLDVVDRKKKGAFYTPREIVHYMCQESLINYLITEIGINYKDAETLIRYGDVLADIDSSKKAFDTGDFKMPLEVRRNAKKIDYALLNVKVADPAVGSGAFPLGMLNEIVRARMNLTQYMVDEINAIHRAYSNVRGRKPYDLKLQTIQRCIHAVDIERSAVDIAKLRLWLSLVVEENDFKNVKPLPNLDYNIMVGNSLLEEFEGVKLFNEKLLEEKSNDDEKETAMEQIGFLNGKKESEYILDEVYNLQEKFFSANNKEEKIKLKDDIDKLEWLLIEKTVKENGREDLLSKIKEFKRTKTKPYFLWKLNFARVFRRERPGFDILIGNPPYIKEYTNSEIFKPLKNSPYYQGKMDFWYFFACIGIDLLRSNGVQSYIAPNNWITNTGASVFRNKIVADTKILKYIDFNNYKVFDTADIQTMIYVIKKDSHEDNYAFEYSKLSVDNIKEKQLSEFLNSEQSKDYFEKYEVNFIRNDYFDKYLTFNNSIVDKILNKINSKRNFTLDKNKEITNGLQVQQETLNKKNQEKLGEDFKVGQGIFFLTAEEKDALNLTKKELELLKPVYTTDEVSRYYSNEDNKIWVIYTDSSFKDITKMNEYPDLKKHLDKFNSIITTDNKPYGIHRARNESFFKGEKIVSVRKCSIPTFSYIDFDSYVNQVFYVIKTDRANLKYLTALFNSKLIEFWLLYKGKMQGSNYQVDKEPILDIPIRLDGGYEKRIIELVDLIIERKQDGEDSELFEKEVDSIIYEVYDLTEKEIEEIESIIIR